MLFKQTRKFIVIDGEKYVHYMYGTKWDSTAWVCIEGINWYRA